MLGFNSLLICTWEILLALVIFEAGIRINDSHILQEYPLHQHRRRSSYPVLGIHIVCSLGIALTYANLAEMVSMWVYHMK